VKPKVNPTADIGELGLKLLFTLRRQRDLLQTNRRLIDGDLELIDADILAIEATLDGLVRSPAADLASTGFDVNGIVAALNTTGPPKPRTTVARDGDRRRPRATGPAARERRRRGKKGTP
jgi:hypothetical protein